MNEIVYPIIIQNYVPEWGYWEVVRELVSNAEDTGKSWKLSIENGNLVVADQGDGIAIRNLLLGSSEKESSDAIGQFGEGLKLAILVLTRLNHSVKIYSGSKMIWNDTAIIENETVLKLCWKEIPAVTGTKVVVSDWPEKENSFTDRFLFNGNKEDDDPQDDDRILVVTTSGSLLSDPKLFVKGVFVSELENYAFGYSLDNLKMNRDRGAVSENDVQRGVGYVWSNVASGYAWKMLFSHINSFKLEKSMMISSWNIEDDVKNAIKEGFYNFFGKNACLYTNDDMEREATHRGGKVIDVKIFGYYLNNVLSELIKSDKDFIIEKGGLKPKVFKAKELSPEQATTIKKLKSIAKKIGFDGTIQAVEMEPLGAWDAGNNIISINVNLLDDAIEASATMIHELSHAIYGGSDMTEKFNRDCCKIGARLFL